MLLTACLKESIDAPEIFRRRCFGEGFLYRLLRTEQHVAGEILECIGWITSRRTEVSSEKMIVPVEYSRHIYLHSMI